MRFRIFIPINESISAKEYGLIAKGIVCVVKHKEKGTGRCNGFDASKMNAANQLYLPCQQKDQAKSFFKVFADADRYPLCAEDWLSVLKYDEPAPLFIETPVAVSNYNENRVNNAIEKWHMCCKEKGKGGDNFFDLGLALGGAGCSEYEIKSILRTEASYAVHPNQRIKQITSIIDSLWNYHAMSAF